MTDRDRENKMLVDFLVRFAKNPMEVVGEIFEEMDLIRRQRDDYRALLEDIAKYPKTRMGWLASEALRKEHTPRLTEAQP